LEISLARFHGFRGNLEANDTPQFDVTSAIPVGLDQRLQEPEQNAPSFWISTMRSILSAAPGNALGEEDVHSQTRISNEKRASID
jgi:hypothetical protein